MAEASSTSQEGTSYRNVLKSTSLIGGASLLNILISMVRNKFIAILLGPTGIGLIGLFGQITSLIATITGMGIASSGVRQVAEAVGSGDDELIARTVISLRRTAWLTGAFGLLVMVIFSVPISRITFGSGDYAGSIAVLGITLLTGSIAAGQVSIINGTRRLGDLAKISVIGALNGTLISIPCFYIWGQTGIVPSLVLSSLAALVTSWWFSRMVEVKVSGLSWRDSYGASRQLLKLGVSFMGAGLVAALANYLIQIVMLRQFGMADVGIYQAAYNLSGVLAGFVLGAMGADYYPRLTAVANDNVSVHRMVNEQSQISILLALPGLAAMMVFAPLIIKLFYSGAFVTAVPVLRWCLLGILGRVFSWPMGFVTLAKGKGKVFFVTELLGCVLHLGAVFFFIKVLGLTGAGVAFMAVYLLYTFLMLFVMHRLVGATWNRRTLQLTLIASMTMVLLMLNGTLNNNPVATWGVNVVVLIGVSWFCLHKLLRHSDVGVQALLVKLRLRNVQKRNY